LFVTSSCRPRRRPPPPLRGGSALWRDQLTLDGLVVHALSSFQRTKGDVLAAVRVAPCTQCSSGEPYETTTRLPIQSSRNCALRRRLSAELVDRMAFRAGTRPQTGDHASSTNAYRNEVVTPLSRPGRAAQRQSCAVLRNVSTPPTPPKLMH